ncbi:MAG: squalene synthase HpnC [Burkholderiaceae bacterium]|jgi:squalene synthase HpnC
MAINHYENFPVASLLLPRRLREPVSVVYRFARSADDLADEGDAPAAMRLAALRAYDAQLVRIEQGLPLNPLPEAELFRALAAVILRFSLPVKPFRDLLSAFSQDAVTGRYENFPSVLDYCTRSANPVGRIMLGLYHCDTEEQIAWSDQICTALQLINFWQDVAVDLAKGRAYLPLEDLRRYGLRIEDLAAQVDTSAWREMMAFQCDRARTMMLSGAPLVRTLPGRIGLELRFVVQGGLRVLDKIAKVDYDVFSRRPVLRRADWPTIAARALSMRT